MRVLVQEFHLTQRTDWCGKTEEVKHHEGLMAQRKKEAARTRKKRSSEHHQKLAVGYLLFDGTGFILATGREGSRALVHQSAWLVRSISLEYEPLGARAVRARAAAAEAAALAVETTKNTLPSALLV